MRAVLLAGCLLPSLAAATQPPAPPPDDGLAIDDTLTPDQLMGAMLVTEADDALKAARAHLDAGKLDDVLESLEGRVFPESRKVTAAGLLARTASRALDRDDGPLALLAAQLALRHDKDNAEALSVAARTCRKSQEFSAAERYADRWIVVEKDAAEPRLLRAELAFDQGEWARTVEILKPLGRRPLGPQQQARKELLEDKARQELAAIEEGTEVQRAVEAKVRKFQGGQPVASPKTPKPRKPPPSEPAPAAPPPAVAGKAFERGDADVVFFSTQWCGGFCKRARSWLKLKGIRYVEYDIERDPGAAEAMKAVAKKAGLAPRGVPAFDVRGQFIQGFDEQLLQAALR